jgi:prepilin-type N-terminal cleavage/methylation domain-containing protein
MKINQKGFTLIELIIVIAIIALLAAATFVAVNPAKRIGDANNAQRWADVSAIADAYVTYLADNSGTAPTTTPSPTSGVTYAVATTTGGTTLSACEADTGNPTTTTLFVDLSALVTGGYIGAIPKEPDYASGDIYQTGYYFYTDGSTYKVGSCATYNTTNIEVIR